MSAIRSGSIPRWASILIACLGLWSPLNAVAATWRSSTAPVAQAITSGALTAPTGVSAACKLLTFRVTIQWTPDPSTLTAGYAILRATAASGPYSLVGTVTGGSTASFDDPAIAVAANYYYEVRATHALWGSAASSPIHVLTALGLCN
jgi:hypothetical protein